MKLDFEMSEKDKRLLVFLGIFVVIVCFGYWGIRPIVNKIMEIDEDIVDAESVQQTNERKIAELPLLQADNEKMEQSITEARNNYFSMMSSDEVDRYFTDMVLTYQLDAYDLNIQMPEDNCDLEPYQYSEKYLMPEEVDVSLIGKKSSDDEDEDEDIEEDEVENGIYMASVTMRLGGAQNDLTRLIDDLSNSTQKLRLASYSYATQQSILNGVDGAYELQENRVLNITVEIYMCEDETETVEQ